MIGLDTNVLVRLLTRDDARQLSAARDYISSHFGADNPAFVNRTVIVETVWVLESTYDEYTRTQIADAVEGLLNAAEFLVEDVALLRWAVKEYRGGADFTDAAIAAINAAQRCTKTATFDKRAIKQLPHFAVLS